ncbi:hypothetical protein HDF26_005229 [Pedobacter cryoconitis]|uniref:Uncharacterized protein n=1 Tax=Pedobacter cryoconitis TaxID=188932 RepID=A0A7W8ZMI9_9SPHI|nr:hypothetical protein [Pedobacter cryoconitis]MBB5636753.1 hypothetical protein [Pedobacter cryoconitis]MBB6274747.1 hypothetical protein [Pedobacter cryoconitis]
MENIQESLEKISLREIAQTPFAYALYVVTMVLVSVIVTERFDAGTAKEDYSRKIEQLENMVKAERKEKDEVFKAYLIERSANLQIQKTVDSTAISRYKYH